MRKSYILLLIALLLLTACRTGKTIQVVEVPIVQRDTMRVVDLRRDSIHVHDSIYMIVKGDTVEKYVYRDRWRERVTHDTIYRHQVDTITTVVTKTEIVRERYTPSWIKIFAYVGIVSVLFLVVSLYLRFR